MSSGQQMTSSANNTMMEVIQIVTAHTADVIMHMMQILSEKYSHPIEEMLECIRTNPQFHSINIHPILTKEFFESNTLPAPKKTGRKPKVIPAPIPIVTTPISVPQVTPVTNPLSPKRVVKIIKKTVVNTDLGISNDVSASNDTLALASPSSTTSNDSTESQDSVIINMPQPVIIVHDDEEVAIKPTEPPKPVKKVIKIVKKSLTPETTTLEPATLEPATLEPATLEPATLEPATLEPIALVGDSKDIKPHNY
jgi:hypothetical protein